MKNAILEELQAIAGWTDEDMEQITIVGHDPVLRTTFKVGETAASVMAACGLAAAKLWELRTGHKQHVTVDVSEASAALLSCLYTLTVKDNPQEAAEKKPAAKVDPETEKLLAIYALAGCYKTRDNRWFYLHTSNDPQAALDVLGCEPTKEAITAAFLSRDAQELEDAFAANGANGALIRSPEEWLETEQGSLLNSLPVVEITKIGDCDPVPLPEGNRPLSGIRCLDLTRVLAGPIAARTLAEHGSEVLWIGAEHLPDALNFAIDTGHGKRAAFVDIRTPEGKDKLWNLIEKTDVFSQNYRLGSKLGQEFSAEILAEKHPGIIYSQLNTYGQTGPWARRPGYEQLAQAVTGLMLEQASLPCPEPDPVIKQFDALSQTLYYSSFRGEEGVPRLIPSAFNDVMTGYLGGFGIMVALYKRATEGGSYKVSAALAQSSMALNRMGRVDRELALTKPDTVPFDIVTKMMRDEYTNLGHIKYVGPVVRLSETPGYFELPTIKRGTSEPKWLD